MMLREIGLVLFLTQSVGIKAVQDSGETVVQGDGIKYVYTGFLITSDTYINNRNNSPTEI